MAKFDDNTIARFWSRVEIAGDDACWEWAAGRSKGYGMFKANGRTRHAHVFAWVFAGGEDVPAETPCVCHTCDNPGCCNPAHLWLGTHADNMRDKEKKGRGNQPSGDRQWTRLYPELIPRGDAHHARARPEVMARGEGHGNAKITDEDVRAMRSRRKGGESLTSIARDYGLASAHVGRICSRKSWAHVA